MSRVFLFPILCCNLRVIFVGTEPGEESLRLGHYYANRNNSFYRDLASSGFTSVVLSPEHDQELRSCGIGLDDVYHDPDALMERIKDAAPKAICFNSKRALEWYVGRKVKHPWEGVAAARHAQFPGVSVVWAIHDSSGLSRRYRGQRLALLRELKDLLRGEAGDRRQRR